MARQLFIGNGVCRSPADYTRITHRRESAAQQQRKNAAAITGAGKGNAMRQKRAAAAHLERRSRICWYAQAAERRRIAAHERPAKGDGKENPLRKARTSLPTAGRPNSRLRRLDFSSPNGACGMMPLSPFRRPGKRGADSFGGVCPSRPNRKGAPRPTPRRCPCRLRGRPIFPFPALALPGRFASTGSPLQTVTRREAFSRTCTAPEHTQAFSAASCPPLFAKRLSRPMQGSASPGSPRPARGQQKRPVPQREPAIRFVHRPGLFRNRHEETHIVQVAIGGIEEIVKRKVIQKALGAVHAVSVLVMVRRVVRIGHNQHVVLGRLGAHRVITDDDLPMAAPIVPSHENRVSAARVSWIKS